MKLVLVGPTYPFRGGISQYTESLYTALSEQPGCEVLLISFSRQYPGLIFPGTAQFEENSRHPPTTAERLLDSLDPMSWLKVARRILEFEAEVVIFQWWQPFFGPAYARIISRLKRRSRLRVLFLCHNVYPHESLSIPGGKAIEKLLIRRAFRQVDGFLVHSRKLGREVRAFNRVATIKRIYHPRYSFYSKWDGGGPPKSPSRQLLFFGKIRHYKGLDVFLQSLRLLLGKLSFQATVAGEFYIDAQPFRRMVEEWKLSEHLVWKDYYIDNREVPRLFRGSDLVILPYHEATQSGVVPLAYQFDVPVVASDVGGLSEIVLDGKTGYLFPAGDAPALAEKVLLYFREEKKEEFQSNIRIFKQRLSWQQVVDNIQAMAGEMNSDREPSPSQQQGVS